MSSPRLCTAKAFFDCGWSIGWTAIDNLGVDMKSARKFVEDHVLSSVDGKQTVQVHVKARLGAPVRSIFTFVLQGPTKGSIISCVEPPVAHGPPLSES